MSRLAASFGLGYHGCENKVAARAVRGEIDLLQSDRNYDWLGPGAYFWESDPRRAFEWAVSRGHIRPRVIGAVIDLRNCLDLVSRQDMTVLADAYRSFLQSQTESGLPIPQNRSLSGRSDSDKLLRFLDCAVIRHLHDIMARKSQEPFDTVRGMFMEGGELYPGSAFRQQSHVRLAVSNPACILGIFLPRPEPAL